jgi:hypothetical protein
MYAYVKMKFHELFLSRFLEMFHAAQFLKDIVEHDYIPPCMIYT